MSAVSIKMHSRELKSCEQTLSTLISLIWAHIVCNIQMQTNKEHKPMKLEDLKVLRRSPDLFNNVKIGQGQLPLISIKHILFYHIWGLQPFWESDLKQSNEYSIKQPSDF